MALDCTADTFFQAASCYLDPCRNEEQRRALRVYFLRLGYLAMRGSSEEDADAAISNAACNCAILSPQYASAGLVWLYRQLAEELGAEIPDEATINAATACANCTPNNIAAELWLLCQIYALLVEGQGGIQ